MAERWPLMRIAGTLAGLLGALEKISADVMLSTRSEVGELRLSAAGGSSTMPQKQNPVAAETLIALTRHAAALSAQITTAPAHAEERDGAAWMGEWLVLPPFSPHAGRHCCALRRWWTRSSRKMSAWRRSPSATAAWRWPNGFPSR
ncbi:MAG: hypothetical protein HPM95_03610 [Alphaproteobacteria bacterium]|nr:hypothetical protein [Alphaproteobacteria bacterium]